MSRDPSPQAFALREEIDVALARRSDFEAWSPALKEAHQRHSSETTFSNLRFQVVVGFLISMSSLFWDFFAVPEKFDVALAWRLFSTVPITAIALTMINRNQVQLMKLLAATSLISFATMSVYLGTHGTTEVMARYTMGSTFLLGICCFALPFRPIELRVFSLAFAVATSLIALWPNPLPPFQMALHLSFLTMVTAPCWAISRRYWNKDARSFLLDLRDDLTREELEANNLLLRQLSEQDPLTGMPNRRQFERVFDEEFARPRKGRAGSLAVMMIDLDHFKQFNDRHGHQAGDRCLAMAGNQLQDVFGERRGIVARYGGEEFVAVMQESFTGEGAYLAEEMRAAIAQMLVPVRDDSSPLITTSIGLAIGEANGSMLLDDLIEMADAALYSAKRAGRNRVEAVSAIGEVAKTYIDDEDRRRA
ncbi:MAG: sensor domain-containing diguanylate cyclase [Sphingomonadales bacterium]|nr:MAG: sensor domain-containing diguanylate cyclase [Sphingomonadales bacterium]